MDFADSILARLADEGGRAALFDSAGLRGLLQAGYNVDALGIEGAVSARFDSVQIGYRTRASVQVSGSWQGAADQSRMVVELEINGLAGVAASADALWVGALAARSAATSSPLESMSGQRVDLQGIDEDIRTANGELPADRSQLERQRRQRVIARVRSRLNDANGFDESGLDRWLGQLGVASAGDLLALRSDKLVESLQITFAAPASVAPTAPLTIFPVVVAVLVLDTGFSVRRALADTRSLQSAMASSDHGQPVDRGLRRRRDAVVAWLVPPATFDDGGWPGGVAGMSPVQLRDARRANAGAWLSSEGVGLCVVRD